LSLERAPATHKSSTAIEGIFKKKNASEIDDIFAKKSVEKSVGQQEAEEKEYIGNDEPATGASKAAEEVVFAELAAVKASKKRAAQPKIADDDGFSDSRGKKSSMLLLGGFLSVSFVWY
jgi:hypothetical protein